MIELGFRRGVEAGRGGIGNILVRKDRGSGMTQYCSRGVAKIPGGNLPQSICQPGRNHNHLRLGVAFDRSRMGYEDSP